MPMKLSLSVRVAEKFQDKREASMTLHELSELAVAEGYDALCMRASQLGINSSADCVSAARGHLDECGLAVSMVTGDFAIPENSTEATLALRCITPHLDLVEALGADLMRVTMKHDEDVVWAQRAADEAGERGLRLAHQCHTSSLFERVDESIEVLRKIGRPNFGIIYEPANLELCGEDYGFETLRKLQPHLFNVYLQNQQLKENGQHKLPTWTRGEARFDLITLWEEGGVDFPAIMDALQEIGYEGYVTVHQAFEGLGGPRRAARESVRYLRSLLSM